jgi:hypothetical protein
MAENEPIAFGPKAVEQIAKTVREVARRMQNETPHRGRWQQRPGGSGGGSEWIEFTVVDVFCKGDYDNEEDEFYITATVDWYSNSCTTAPTGYDEYTGTIKIFDKCVLQYYSPDQLMGLNGYTVKSGLASLMRPFRKDSCEPRWLCQSVCGEVLCGDTDWPPEDEEETE